MYFDTKSYLKNIHNHTAKQILIMMSKEHSNGGVPFFFFSQKSYA